MITIYQACSFDYQAFWTTGKIAIALGANPIFLTLEDAKEWCYTEAGQYTVSEWVECEGQLHIPRTWDAETDFMKFTIHEVVVVE